MKLFLFIISYYFRFFFPKKIQFRLLGFKTFKFRNKIIFDNQKKLFRLKKIPNYNKLDSYYNGPYWKFFNEPSLISKRDLLHFNFINSFFDINKTQNFVNYGSGPGGISYLISPLMSKIYNVDYYSPGPFSESYFKSISNEIFFNNYFDKDSIDFVYTSHCLEHLSSIDRFMENSLNILKKNGILVGEVPNGGAKNKLFQDRVGGSNFEIMVPHIYYFTEDFFYNIKGFNVLKIIKYDSSQKIKSMFDLKSEDGDSLFFILQKK
mgnify:CR=1 FL=1